MPLDVLLSSVCPGGRLSREQRWFLARRGIIFEYCPPSPLLHTWAVIASNPKARVPLCLKMLDDDVAVVVYTATNYLHNVECPPLVRQNGNVTVPFAEK